MLLPAGANSTLVSLVSEDTLTNKTLTTPKIGTSILDTNGNELAKLTATSSAINEFTVANAASSNAPRLSATGETNVDLDLLAKGTGHVTIRGNTNPGTIQFNCESNSHGQQLKPQPHSVGSSAVHTLPDITGDLIAGKIGGTNFTNSLLVGHATHGTLNAAQKNTGVGITALDAIVSGDGHTAVGFDSGSGEATGTETTYVGMNSGKVSNGASYNVGIGSISLAATSNSQRNTAVGWRSLLQLQNGQYNTAMGAESGKNITGARNITLGANAGDNITSGDGNVVLGMVDVDSATGDRQLKIAGHDGSTTTTWISGDSSGNVVIGGTVTEYGGASLTTTGKALVMGF
jgi:hypothetical protein